MRLLVCGGRDFNNQSRVFHVLYKIHEKRPITEIIHGDARGADSLAGRWAQIEHIKETAVPADWDTHGKAAGLLRNQQMLEMKPDGVVAFPGGRGTAHMVRIAKQEGITVMEIPK